MVDAPQRPFYGKISSQEATLAVFRGLRMSDSNLGLQKNGVVRQHISSNEPTHLQNVSPHLPSEPQHLHTWTTTSPSICYLISPMSPHISNQRATTYLQWATTSLTNSQPHFRTEPPNLHKWTTKSPHWAPISPANESPHPQRKSHHISLMSHNILTNEPPRFSKMSQHISKVSYRISKQWDTTSSTSSHAITPWATTTPNISNHISLMSRHISTHWPPYLQPVSYPSPTVSHNISNKAATFPIGHHISNKWVIRSPQWANTTPTMLIVAVNCINS